MKEKIVEILTENGVPKDSIEKIAKEVMFEIEQAEGRLLLEINNY
jgi:hypothetical protein